MNVLYPSVIPRRTLGKQLANRKEIICQKLNKIFQISSQIKCVQPLISRVLNITVFISMTAHWVKLHKIIPHVDHRVIDID